MMGSIMGCYSCEDYGGDCSWDCGEDCVGE